MTRSLGVHGTAAGLWFSCVDEGDQVVEIGPDYHVTPPGALESGEALLRLTEDLRMLIKRHGVARVRLLDAEPSAHFKFTYQQLAPRVTLETVVAYACALEHIDFARVPRGHVRSVLGLPKTGALRTHAIAVAEKQGPNWGPDKRDLAVLTALAAHREAESA